MRHLGEQTTTDDKIVFKRRVLSTITLQMCASWVNVLSALFAKLLILEYKITNSFYFQCLFQGEIKPYYRSNQTNSFLPPSDVKELTGETFQSEVLDGNFDTLVMLYHPLAKNWRLTFAVLQDLTMNDTYKAKKIQFAVLDASANDVPAYFKLPHYPMIYFVPKGYPENPVEYNGSQSDEAEVRLFLDTELERFKIPEICNDPVKTEL